jgi:ATP-dependent helicase HrpA
MKPAGAPIPVFPEDAVLSRDRGRLLRLLGALRKSPDNEAARKAYETALQA